MQNSTKNRQRGTSLLETLIATAICAVAVFSLAGLVTVAAKQSKNQGSTLAQSSTLSAQKLEELLGLPFNDSHLNAGGDLTSNATDYSDYLDSDGATLTTGKTIYFVRRWTVATETGTIKLITVRVEGRPVSGAWDPTANSDSAPSTVVCSRKAMQ